MSAERFNPFVAQAKEAAQRADVHESSSEYVAELISQVRQDIDAGISSREEGMAVLAKLDAATEAAQEQRLPALMIETSELRRDIAQRYPDLIR